MAVDAGLGAQRAEEGGVRLGISDFGFGIGCQAELFGDVYSFSSLR